MRDNIVEFSNGVGRLSAAARELGAPKKDTPAGSKLATAVQLADIANRLAWEVLEEHHVAVARRSVLPAAEREMERTAT